jgi:hypothetical protein
MPTFRKLTPEEAARVSGIGPRKATELEYDSYIRDFTPGDYGEVQLHDNEKRMTIMNRLKAAAGRQNPPLRLVFQRTGSDMMLRFKVLSMALDGVSEELAEAVSSDAPPARGGRLRKRAAE